MVDIPQVTPYYIVLPRMFPRMFPDGQAQGGVRVRAYFNSFVGSWAKIYQYTALVHTMLLTCSRAAASGVVAKWLITRNESRQRPAQGKKRRK